MIFTCKENHYDTMLESYVLDSAGNRHDIEILALKNLNYQMINYETLAGKGAKQIAFDEIPLEAAAHYAAEMAQGHYRYITILGPN